MDNYDPYDSGIPKYQTAADIYEALQAVASGEEIGILSEMFGDVSWENQDYYYTDNGGKLEERWNDATDYGDKMWLMDVAAWQMTDDDANEWIYEALCNEELAKRIGFKKIFVDTACGGMKSLYDAVAKAFEAELQELNRFDFNSNSTALKNALMQNRCTVYVNPYGDLCSAVYKKLKGMRLEDERQLIVESRALCTAYDDFMFGLKSNQYLYNQQEAMYGCKVAQLQGQYDNMVKALLASAQAQGIILNLPEAKLLEVQTT
ncbi:hypothetical protein NE562_11625 [Butyricicoccus faecihominis]|uniref:hypothetical protein n=1 Tax=Butyricicoccus faecihominis TaxID=1712515 RepID=UPI0024789EE2|nr:hypothetical protein [Butyricicoccus faecihominis]MCQ5130312.1 hypothetical protein [Butyricicoccus faecihominis]